MYAIDGLPAAVLQADETPEAWTFESAEVAAKFDDHVREQLPWYEALSRFTAEVAVSFIPRNGVVYDIGSSTGNMARLIETAAKGKSPIFFSVEPSRDMADRWRGPGTLLVMPGDQVDYIAHPPDVAVLFLCVMFMDPGTRSAFINKLADAVRPGGAIIIVDKGYLGSPRAQVACKAAQLAEKLRCGTPSEGYAAKELSLRGEQRPTDKELLREALEAANFEVEEFFRFGEFFGQLAIKRGL